MSNRFVSGTDGRVRTGVGNNVLGGVTGWKFGKKTTLIPIPHLESPVGAVDGQVYPNQLKGLSAASGSLDGYFDTDPTVTTDIGTPGIYNGASVTLDLMLSKANTWGFYNIAAIISDFEITLGVDNKPTTFTCAFTVDGAPPMSSGTPA